MRLHVLALSLVAAGCNGDATGTTSVIPGLILVSGSDMGPLFENINLSVAGSPLSGAAVFVNGTPVPETQAGHYAGQLPASLPAGAAVEIMVVSGSDTITGGTTVPTAPTILAPAGGTTIHIPVPLDFTWIDAGNPDAFRIAIQYNGTAEVASYGPTARSGLVVTSRIPASATNLSAYVYAYGDGTFSGRLADPNSKMHVRQPSQTVALTLGP